VVHLQECLRETPPNVFDPGIACRSGLGLVVALVGHGPTVARGI